MTALPVIDQEFVVHLFAPLDGPQAAEAYRQLRQVWTACREQMGMTEPIAEIPAPSVLPEAPDRLPAADGVVAAQEGRAGVRQAVARRLHDALNLSVALAQPAPDGLRPPGPGSRRRMGWSDYAQMWAQASPRAGGALLGEARLFLARTPPEHAGAVDATAEFGRSLDPLLPYREDRPQGWWELGTTTDAGYALWDTLPAADTSPSREIVLIAASDRDDDLSAWAWSDGTPGIPPFARYLLHAAKLRYEARLLDAWHRAPPGASDIDGLVAELNVALTPGQAREPAQAGLLSSRLERLRAAEARLIVLEAELSRLRQTVSIARRNLGSVPGCQAGDGSTGMFAADQALARWLTEQIEGDLSYVTIDLGRTRRVRELAAEELGQARSAGLTPRSPAAPAAADLRDVARRVFVVHGRDGTMAGGFRDLLRAVGLEPLEWEMLVAATGSTAPYLGQVVARAPHLAQATLVLLTPDDIVELHPDLFQPNDLPQERARSGQARPNVLFELGLALMAYPERTVVVEAGQMRPVADIAGLNVIRFDGSAVAVKKVLDRLKLAGCPVNYSGTDWLANGRFANMAAYERGPTGCAGIP